MKAFRHSFGKTKSPIDMPDLLEIQLDSYEKFLQMDVKPEDRKNEGLQGIFKEQFPVTDSTSSAELDFVKYEIEKPEYSVKECIKRDMTYSGKLKVHFRLIIWDTDENTGAKTIRDIKEQEVFMGSIPLMTERASFIFNGDERAIVSQLQRAQGVFFSNGKAHISGKIIYNARIIPYRGSWLDFETDYKDIIYAKIDRRRKLPATTVLYALPGEADGKNPDIRDVNLKGMTKQEILKKFYLIRPIERVGDKWRAPFKSSYFNRTYKLIHSLVDAKTGKTLLEKGMRINKNKAEKLEKEGLTHYLLTTDELVGFYSYDQVLDPVTNEVILDVGGELTEEVMGIINTLGLTKLNTIYIDHVNVGSHILDTLNLDKNNTREKALAAIYSVMRPGEPATVEASADLFYKMFFDPIRFALSGTGRFKMNRRLGISYEDAPEDLSVLRKEDILAVLKELIRIKDGNAEVDDIDNLANRRVRSVGELLENSFRMVFVRTERQVKEKIGSVNIDTVQPMDVINAKPVITMLKEFFGASQLSQYLDSDNPLAEVENKRRISALGPSGLTRDRAGYEVRDVHPTHYGRICPVQSPEGANIGLILSLSTYAKVNQYGFLETPYRKVVDGKITDEVIYLSALDEGKYTIAQASEHLTKKGTFENELINVRRNGEFMMVPANEVDLMDVSTDQIVSVATSLIPFVENDDANRALMGSNMQRQAVPLIRPEAPLVGTGMEMKTAVDSKAVIVAKNNGVVQAVDGDTIVIKILDSKKKVKGVDIYTLDKFSKTNKGTCINQKPLVKVGQEIKVGDIIADGQSTDNGELALGRNMLIAFMPWNGYNFEDSVLISERIVRDDIFTSIHIDEYETSARDTKLGQEEFTRDIPNVSEEALRNLDDSGIITIGSSVKPGDILVGRVTPKGESFETPEEKLLRTIFGEKAMDVKDASLRMPPGSEGTVVDVRVFSRRGVKKDERALIIEQQEIEKLKEEKDTKYKIYKGSFIEQMQGIAVGKVLAANVKGFGKKGDKVSKEDLENASVTSLKALVVDDPKIQEQIKSAMEIYEKQLKEVEENYEVDIDKLRRGDELLPGVLKSVKVSVAIKRKLQPGDKVAGRHGNKGVISKVVPIEDMPYQENGQPVDIVLTPLGVPSRMNIGQILETHMGWACKGIGDKINAIYEQYKQKKASINEVKDAVKSSFTTEEQVEIDALSDADFKELAAKLSKRGLPIATPVFDGAKEKDIEAMLKKAGLDKSGQVQLFDGKTGEPYDRKTTVGYMYMLKLHHLVDEKIHARSVGSYSLVNQQPLGGKANFGGQRFGEMEVWALEAYGAAHVLQEMLTVKSDDVAGRTRVYETIVRGDNNFEAGVPESFNVLVKEMQSLGLNVELKKYN
ncbi:MAG: DNA-directed RNA polymerase subunit beta [Rickettsiales bacterium]|jgi:DNA-directed RNA polymerase subunit beta|nr:DNA-directed RNA polymerase subunit beta [Rickettsiales bacterium]